MNEENKRSETYYIKLIAYFAVGLSILSLITCIGMFDISAENNHALTTTVETVSEIAETQQKHIDITKINNRRINDIEHNLSIDSDTLNGYEVEYIIVRDLQDDNNLIQLDPIEDKYIIVSTNGKFDIVQTKK